MAGNDSYTKLLLHCNGTDASTSFPDSSASVHSVTAVGNAQVDTAQSEFGGASFLTDGSGDRLTVPNHEDFNFGTGDFTIDFWVRPSSFQTIWNTLISKVEGAAYFQYLIRRDNNTVRFASSGTGDVDGSYTFSLNTWYHLAAVRYGTSFKTYVNGTNVGSITSSAAMANPNNVLCIGAREEGDASFSGWMDEIRISKGIARWTSDFTPPTEEYSADSGGGNLIGGRLIG